jgi:hypothetical protein
MVIWALMPVVAAPLLGLSLGVLFAWAGAEEIARSGGAATSRSLLVAVLFGLLVYAPACGYFPAFFPDWSYAYALDAERRPVALDMLLVLSCALCPAGGFAMFARAAASRRDRVLARGAASHLWHVLGVPRGLRHRAAHGEPRRLRAHLDDHRRPRRGGLDGGFASRDRPSVERELTSRAARRTFPAA